MTFNQRLKKRSLVRMGKDYCKQRTTKAYGKGGKLTGRVTKRLIKLVCVCTRASTHVCMGVGGRQRDKLKRSSRTRKLQMIEIFFFWDQ